MPRGYKTLHPWKSGVGGLWLHGQGQRGLIFALALVPCSRDSEGGWEEKKAQGSARQGHSPSGIRYPPGKASSPHNLFLLHPPWLDPPSPPKKLGSMLPLDKHQLPWPSTPACPGGHPLAFYSISTPRGEISTTGCVAGKHRLHQ